MPTFLALIFVLLPLWAIWYFLTHLAPLMAIQPSTLPRSAPAAVRSYRSAEALAAPTEVSALARGAAIYLERCAMCHGQDGQGQTSGPYTAALPLRGDPLVLSMTLPQLEALIGNGFPGDMPAWNQELGSSQIHDVALFVQDVLGRAAPPAAAGSGTAASTTTSATSAGSSGAAGPA